ncbi:MAG: metallophosphoesterase [Bacteroidia bacterium]
MPKISRAVLTLILILVFFAWFDIYLFSGINAASQVLPPLPSRILTYTFCVLLIGGALLISYLLLHSRKPGQKNNALQGILLPLIMLVFIPALFVGILLLGEDVYRIGRMLITTLIHALGRDRSLALWVLEPRSGIYSLCAILAGTGLFAGLVYAVTFGKYRYKVHRVEVLFPDLPEAFDGFTITQLSDIHAGSFDDEVSVRKAIQKVNEQKSDVIFFTGDLVNNSASEMEPWVEVFKATRAAHGKYSILGNHDYGDYRSWPSDEHKAENLLELFHMHERIGFNLLRNENLKIEKDGQHIELLGIENWGSGRFAKYGDLAKTLEGTRDDAFKILLSHDPSHWTEQVLQSGPHIHLTLSGHTHGMQFGFEFLGWRFSPIQFRYKQWAGLYEQDKRFLYVNRGFGFLGFPGRLGIWPEITVITLKKKR